MIIHKESKIKPKHYSCNYAIGKGNPDKLTNDWDKVTCKNCLNHKPKIKHSNPKLVLRLITGVVNLYIASQVLSAINQEIELINRQKKIREYIANAFLIILLLLCIFIFIIFLL